MNQFCEQRTRAHAFMLLGNAFSRHVVANCDNSAWRINRKIPQHRRMSAVADELHSYLCNRLLCMAAPQPSTDNALYRNLSPLLMSLVSGITHSSNAAITAFSVMIWRPPMLPRIGFASTAPRSSACFEV